MHHLYIIRSHKGVPGREWKEEKVGEEEGRYWGLQRWWGREKLPSSQSQSVHMPWGLSLPSRLVWHVSELVSAWCTEPTEGIRGQFSYYPMCVVLILCRTPLTLYRPNTQLCVISNIRTYDQRHIYASSVLTTSVLREIYTRSTSTEGLTALFSTRCT